MVADADAIIEPGAVVVPALNTPVANATVLRAWRRQHFAPRANVVRVELLYHFEHVVVSFQIARVFAARQKEEKVREQPQQDVTGCHNV